MKNLLRGYLMFLGILMTVITLPVLLIGGAAVMLAYLDVIIVVVIVLCVAKFIFSAIHK